MGPKWVATVKSVIGDEAWHKLMDFAKDKYNGISIDDQGGLFINISCEEEEAPKKEGTE